MSKKTDATWASAPLLVPKPLQDEEELRYRLAFDLRAVNAVTVPLSWPLPHIDSEVADFKGKRFYALIDFISSYWQQDFSGIGCAKHIILVVYSKVPS